MSTAERPLIAPSHARRALGFIKGLLFVLLIFLTSVSAEASPTQVMDAIFGDDVLPRNVSAVRESAADLPTEEQLEYLSQWVLPNKRRSTIRLGIDFSPHNPAPVMRQAGTESDAARQRRANSGGQLVSPALDLINVSRDLGLLSELRERVAAISCSERISRQRRLALLAAIDFELGNIESARDVIDALLARQEQSVLVDDISQSTLVFALHRAPSFPQICAGLSDDMIPLVKNVRQSGRNDALASHLRALANRIRALSEAKGEPAVAADGHHTWTSKQWTPVDRFSAKSRGTGINSSLWQIEGAQAENVASHGHDLLYFAVPLRDNFQVECDVTPFGGHDVELQVAGLWYAPSYTLDKFSKGNIHGVRKYHPLVAKMSKVREWLRYHTSLKDGSVTTSFNGQLVESVEVAGDHDPWIAIHSEQRYEGAARNVHIGGNPVIPDELQLATDPKQTGWCTYYGSSIGYFGAQWQPSPDPKRVRLIGTRRIDQAGTFQEEAIHYHRPMLEDGTVDIDFFYRENEMLVHPAIDRLCFLLKPGGVRIHWLTDGAFDRTELAPDNEFSEPQNRRGPARLPLKTDHWNTIRLQLTGDTVTLTLNGEEIYERNLEPTNQRHFGLFHYADQSEARVRSIIYRGDWPRQLPELTEQELADQQQLKLETALAKLPVVLEHDFTDGLPQNQFTVFGTGWENDIIADTAGLRVTRPGADDNAWYDYMVVPQCVCHGDFDITARFDNFQTDFQSGGYGSTSLRIVLDDENATWFTWYRRTSPEKNHDRNLIEVMMTQKREGRMGREFRNGGSAESVSGILRVARRGERMYFMLAENDSAWFRVLAKLPCSRAPTFSAGIRLLASAHGPGSTAVTWKNVRIRAEKITGLAVEKTDYTPAQLDEQRKKMKPLRELTFSDMPSVVSLFVLTPTPEYFVPQADGLSVFAPGAKNWTSSRLLGREPINGDFDAELDFEVLRMDRPEMDLESTVYLNAKFESPGTPEVQCKYSIDSKGVRTVESQRSTRRKDGSLDYRELHTRLAATITSLRIARRGNVACLLFRREIDSPYEMLGQIAVGPGRLHPNGLQVHVHTGGEGKETKVLLKRLKVDAVEQTRAVATE